MKEYRLKEDVTLYQLKRLFGFLINHLKVDINQLPEEIKNKFEEDLN